MAIDDWMYLYEFLQEEQRNKVILKLFIDDSISGCSDYKKRALEIVSSLSRVCLTGEREADVCLAILRDRELSFSQNLMFKNWIFSRWINQKECLYLSVRADLIRGHKKILIVTNLYPPQELGGYGRSIFDFAHQFELNGHSLQVLTSDAPYLREAAADPQVDRSLQLLGSYENGVSLYDDPDIIRTNLRHNRARLQTILNQFQPDVCLVGNLDLLGPDILQPLLQADIPILHHLGFTLLPYPLGQRPTSPRYRLVAASQDTRQQVQQAGYPASINVVYPGACTDLFADLPLPDPGPLRIAYAGLLMQSKGPHLLLEALVTLQQRGIPFEANIAGAPFSPAYLQQLQQFCDQHQLGDRVRFHGYLERPQLRDLLSQCNTLVFPSIAREAFGIVQVEAMAAGLATISSGVGGAAEVVEHEVSGLRFEPDSSQSLAEALIRLATEPGLMERLARAGRQRAVEVFDIRRSVAQLEAIFAELLQLQSEVATAQPAPFWSLAEANLDDPGALLSLRSRLAQLWQTLPEDLLPQVYRGAAGDLQRRLLASAGRPQPLTPAETDTRAQLRQRLQAGLQQPGALNDLLALMLYCTPEGLRIAGAEQVLPPWLLEDYRRYFEPVVPETVTVF